ncbi:MAG: peptide ABC transporter substrate-binding protein [Paracoccaceae bacterium]
MKKQLLLSTVLSLALALPAIAANPQPGEVLADNQTYTFRLLDAIKTMDPGLNADVEGSDVLRALFEGLYNETSDGSLEPGVATGYDLSADKTTYTFHLRPEAKWSNGDPVTAQDFVYAWQRLADPKTASEYAWYLELGQVVNAAEVTAGKVPPTDLGVKAVDDHTFEVKLIAPLPYFPKMTTNASLFPVHKATIEKFGADWTKPENMVSNGAYVLKEHILGEKVVMERNKNYWDDAHTVMTTVTGLTINDENAGLTRFLAGEVDRTDVPAGQYPQLKQDHPDMAVSTPYSCSYDYVINLTPKGNPALQDVRVRKALSYAVDRDIIVNNVLQGGQKPAYNWTHWAMNGFKMPDIDYSHWTQEERNAKAKELMAEAGYGPDKPLTIQFNYNTSEAHQKVASAIAQMWKQTLGVDLVLNNLEWKVHTDRMQSQDFEMARYAWCADYNEASTFLDVLAGYSGNNNGKYSNPEYDKLLKDAKTADDPNVMYTKAEAILANDMPIIPIYHYAKVDMIQPDIRGLPDKNVMQSWYAKNLYRVKQ